MSDARRIGVYGGTFDPIHQTHLDIARAALTQAELDRVLFVVSATPPHKRHLVHISAEDRFALVQAALSGLGEPRFEASRIEIDREGPSYTVDTLRALSAAHSGAELSLIIGADALVDLSRWHDPAGILSLAHLLVAPRPGFAPEALPELLRGRYTMLGFTETPVSSTEVRAALARGDAPESLVPAGAAALVREKGLYGVARS